MPITKREFLKRFIYGSGYLGLRSLATGLPIWFLADPRRAFAQSACSVTGPGPDTGIAAASAANNNAQFLILSTSGNGDPVNGNVPGTYYDPTNANPAFTQSYLQNVVHPALGLDGGMTAFDPTSFNSTPITLGKQTVAGAKVWGTLPQQVLNRTCFFHCATETLVHPNEPKVLALMGDTAAGECLPSLYAKSLAPIFNTIQPQPISVGAGNFLSYQGQPLPNLPPTALAEVLTQPAGPLAQLQTLRDSTLDTINDILKETGTSAQRSFVDQLATARSDARKVSDALLSQLSCITTNGATGQVVAAVTLIQMKVSPVMVINIPFGGDNHADSGLLQSEAPQTVSGVQTIASLMSQLQAAGIQDQVTFALLNVFGRTMGKANTSNEVGGALIGRTHNDKHHIGLMIGKNVSGSVIGGLVPTSTDFQAAPIDPTTGSAILTTPPSSAITQTASLGAYAKTLGVALGIPKASLDSTITTGQVVPAALTS